MENRKLIFKTEEEAVEFLKKQGYSIVSPTEKLNSDSVETEAEAVEFEDIKGLDTFNIECFKKGVKLLKEQGLWLDCEISKEKWKETGTPLFPVFKKQMDYLYSCIDETESKEWLNIIHSIKTYWFKHLRYGVFGKRSLKDFLYGNQKLIGEDKENTKTMGILSAGSGHECLTRAKGNCRFCKTCYAFSNEQKNKDKFLMRSFCGWIFHEYSVKELGDLLLEFGRPYIRLSEAGEFWDVDYQISKLRELIKYCNNIKFTLYTKFESSIRELKQAELGNIQFRYSGISKEYDTYVGYQIWELLSKKMKDICPCTFKFDSLNCSKCLKCYKGEIRHICNGIHKQARFLPQNVDWKDFQPNSKYAEYTLKEYLEAKGVEFGFEGNCASKLRFRIAVGYRDNKKINPKTYVEKENWKEFVESILG